MSPEQLDEWSERPGSPWPAWTKQVLSDALKRSSRLREYSYEIVVQGSYANKTNIRAHSDVDLVVQMKLPFEEHLKGLDPWEKTRFHAKYENATFGWREFRQDVISALRKSYFVTEGGKCIDIQDWDSLLRIPADIVPAIEYRRYRSFSSGGVETFDEGIYFEDSSGAAVISFPKQHLRNGNRKDAETGGRFKQVVRAVKNARLHLMDIEADEQAKVISSYFIECLFYNVPDKEYRQPTLPAAYRRSLSWLASNLDLAEDFVCQNGLVDLFVPKRTAWSVDSVRYLTTTLACKK
ncbi:nucleotidyltransferase domain-containing protein [Amycolatopsis lexingtonensis]|uniref:nucleotidyltransferase domain-containing protein n=1 Tax=Amycolatopsis lexingtonensis TaxID=218822 RepID=UPI003F705C57